MKIDSIVLIEPKRVDLIYPFSIMHCTWEIRCGALRLFEKVQKEFPGAKLSFDGRKYHLASFLARMQIENTKPKGNTLVLPANVIIDSGFADMLRNKLQTAGLEKSKLLISDGRTVGVWLPKSDLEEYRSVLTGACFSDEEFNGLERTNIMNLKSITYLWDAIEYNGDCIRKDSQYFKNDYKILNKNSFPGVNSINPAGILLSNSVKIMPGAMLDAENGPIILGDNVKIMPQATIMGPCYIGNNSLIKIGAKIYPDNSFGEFCKVGGELENTIIHSFSNKQHDGFLGHSYICEWVNLGADTNNSDLKNTYGNIKILLEKEEIDSGRMFLGLLCGDHTKTAINTSFTTGTAAGICGILVNQDFLPRFIKSFSWGGKKNSPAYKIKKAVEVAKTVMARRGKELLPEEIALMEIEHEKFEHKQ